MKKTLNLSTMLLNLMIKMQDIHPDMCFSYQKKRNSFIFTNVGSKLLEISQIPIEKLINQDIQKVEGFIKEIPGTIPDLYEKAWAGKKVAYYALDHINNLYFVFLYPHYLESKPLKVTGYCQLLEERVTIERVIGLNNHLRNYLD